MHGDFPFRFLFFILWIPSHLEAQQATLAIQNLEDLLYRSETAILPESLLSETDVSGLLQVDLNNSSPEDLEETGLFTPYQLNNLLKYRTSYGEIFSIYELSAIPGFHPSKILEIKPFVIIEHGHVQKENIPLRHTLLIDIGRSFPKSEDYLEDSVTGDKSSFAGPPLKTTFRIRSHPVKKLSLALTYEKDAGELFLYQNRPQFLSGYINYKGDRTIQQLVVGNFKMNQGLGLVNGAGFIHQAGKLFVNQHSLSRIRPYASKTESMFDQGIACQLAIHKIELLMWGSFRRLGLSPAAFTEAAEPGRWLEYQRTSGLYRTKGELEGRELVFRFHTGIQVLYRNNQLVLGLMGGSEWISPTHKAMKYLATNPGPAVHEKASLHANWLKKQLQVFGELAFDGSHSMACLFGTNYYFNDFIQGSLLLHHYGTEYQGSSPSSYSSGSTITNEQGVAFHLHVETGKLVNVEMTGEMFKYPSPRYLTRVPSVGYRLDLSLQNPGNKMLQWKLRVVSKAWETTPAAEKNRLRPIQDSRTSRLDGQLIYNYRDLFKWQSRMVISRYSNQPDQHPGYAALQQITLGSSTYLKATVQFVLFRVADWENRIYLYEPGVYYSFNFPAYFGNGQKTTLLLIAKPTHRVRLSAKISGMTNRGIKKWEAAFQLWLNL